MSAFAKILRAALLMVVSVTAVAEVARRTFADHHHLLVEKMTVAAGEAAVEAAINQAYGDERVVGTLPSSLKLTCGTCLTTTMPPLVYSGHGSLTFNAAGQLVSMNTSQHVDDYKRVYVDGNEVVTADQLQLVVSQLVTQHELNERSSGAIFMCLIATIMGAFIGLECAGGIRKFLTRLWLARQTMNSDGPFRTNGHGINLPRIVTKKKDGEA